MQRSYFSSLFLLLTVVLLTKPSHQLQSVVNGDGVKNLTLFISTNLINVDEARSSMSVLLSFTLITKSQVENYNVGQDVTRAVRSGMISIPSIDLPDPFCLTGKREVVEARVLSGRRLSLRLRLDTNLPCVPKNSFFYPFDDLKCSLHIWVEGWMPTDTLLDLSSSSPRRSVGAFVMTESKIGSDTCPEHTIDTDSAGLGPGSTDNCFVLRFLLERRSGRLLASVYLPTAMIVCLTFLLPWITFLVVPARAVVSGLSFLHLANHTVMARSYIPPDANYTLLDLWLNGCLMSAFCANLAFVMVHRANHGAQKLLDIDISSASETGLVKDEVDMKAMLRRGSLKGGMSARQSFAFLGSRHPKIIDVWARLILPTIFLIFNAGYWSTVFSLSHTYN